MRYGEARRALMERFTIAYSTATRDITEAQRLNEIEMHEQMPHWRAVSLQRLTRIMDRAEASGKLGDAIRAQREITRITGIAAPVEVKHTGAVGLGAMTLDQLADLTDAELDVLSKIDGAPASNIPDVEGN